MTPGLSTAAGGVPGPAPETPSRSQPPLVRPSLVVLLRWAAFGLVAGAAWGAAARLWMRMISTDHGFSWGGTLLIVGFAAAGGLGLGLVRGARVTARRRWWRLSALLAFPIVAAPQGAIVFLPAFLVGGVAVAGRGPRWLQAVLLAIAAAPPLLFWFLVVPAAEREGVPVLTAVLGLELLGAGLAVGGAELFRRWPNRNQKVGERGAPVA